MKFNSGCLRFLQYVWNVKNYFAQIYLCKYVLRFGLTKVKEIWDWSFGCKKALALYTLPVLSYGPIFVHYFRNSKRGFGQFCACTRWQKQWHVCQTHCMEFSSWKSTTLFRILEYLNPSSMYSWSISHILDQEVFCLGPLGSLGQ